MKFDGDEKMDEQDKITIFLTDKLLELLIGFQEKKLKLIQDEIQRLEECRQI